MNLGSLLVSGIFAAALPTTFAILLAYLVICPVASFSLWLLIVIPRRVAFAWILSALIILGLLTTLWGVLTGAFAILIR
jgi:hypothetical protein